MTTSMELRLKFEAALNEFLKENLVLPASNIKILKKSISVKKTKENPASGSFNLHFYNKIKAYSLFCYVNSPELTNFFNKINPPYQANYPGEVAYLASTSSKSGRQQMKGFFYTLNGGLNLPGNDADRRRACYWICEKIKTIYLPRVMNIIDLKPETIVNIIAVPEHYKYPFLTILYIMKKNNISVNDVDMNFIFSSRKSKIVGDKKFDRNLLKIALRTSGQTL